MTADQVMERPIEMPDVTYAVLRVDGTLRFASVPSNAVLRDGEPYYNGAWDAAKAEIRPACGSVARSGIGNGMMAWVADDSLIRPDIYPENVIGGRTLNVLRDVAQRGAEELEWAGTVVITTTEDLSEGERCGAIWPLDEHQEWLIREAHRAAKGDSGSALYIDEDDDWEDDPS